jgi:hypothetical protein
VSFGGRPPFRRTRSALQMPPAAGLAPASSSDKHVKSGARTGSRSTGPDSAARFAPRRTPAMCLSGTRLPSAEAPPRNSCTAHSAHAAAQWLRLSPTAAAKARARLRSGICVGSVPSACGLALLLSARKGCLLHKTGQRSPVAAMLGVSSDPLKQVSDPLGGNKWSQNPFTTTTVTLLWSSWSSKQILKRLKRKKSGRTSHRFTKNRK